MRGDIRKEHCNHILYDLLQHWDVGYSPADVIRQEDTMNIFRHKVLEAFLSVRPEVGKDKPVGLIQTYDSFMPAHVMLWPLKYTQVVCFVTDISSLT